jgi:hypothetical protein
MTSGLYDKLVIQSNQYFAPENALKLIYGKVEFQKISGGSTPGPPLQGEGKGGEGLIYSAGFSPTRPKFLPTSLIRRAS